jgi:aspartyl-tRNA(Asn)/glutamyl-tRNA(Gln) amidotransferase subunit A
MTSVGSIDVTQLSVTSIGGMIAAGDATPSEILEAYLERLNAVEPRVQAWCHLDIEGARATAASLTREAQGGAARGPLHGVPVGVKDEFHVQGMPTYFADSTGRPQPEDATPVARLRAAGAIILGKTHMPIEDKLPPTRNPWNLAHTAGGTSSGSGAAVGARMVPFALGEQTFGSNLRPAAYCGVEGLKPTYGRISRFGCVPFAWSFDHVGLIGLTMEDLAVVLSIIAGPDPRDPTTLQEPPPPADLDMPGMRPPRIGIVRNFFPERTQPVMQAAIERSAARLREGGADVTDFMLPDDFEAVWMAHRLILFSEGATLRGRRYTGPEPIKRSARERLAEVIPATYYVQAQRIRRYFRQKLQGALAGVDALLMAVAPGAAPEGLGSTGDATLLAPWSCLGYPAITVNGGLSPEGLPLGLQLVALPLADHALLRTGAWCEQVLGRLPAPSLPIEAK